MLDKEKFLICMLHIVNYPVTQEEKDNIILMRWLTTHCMQCEEPINKKTHKKNNGFCDDCRVEQQKWEYEHNF